jgi:predicted dehydrogenase
MMSPEKRVRVGFIGVGGMGQCAHLRNYASIPECEVVAAAEIREETGRQAARKYGVPSFYTDARDMLGKEDLDALVMSQPFSRHGILLPEILKAGKPVFIEKPLASTIASGEQIVEAEKASGTFIMVGYHKRSDPATMYARAEMDQIEASGELGSKRLVRIEMPGGDWVANGFWDLVDCGDRTQSLDHEPPAPDMSPESFADYVSFVNFYIHQVNLLRHLLGEPYKVTYADPSGVLFVGESASGVACVIEMAAHGNSGDWQETALVGYQKGSVNITLPAPMAMNRAGTVEILRDPGEGTLPTLTRPYLPWEHAMRQQAHNFLAAVRGERPPTCTATEALEDLRVAREYLRLWKKA